MRMTVLANIKPKFWDIDASGSSSPILFDYKKVWLATLISLVGVSLVPLTMFVVFNLNMAYRTIENENHLRAARITSNTRRTLTFFLEERLDGLRFIFQEKDIEALRNDAELQRLLGHLQMGFGGYVDVGLIDDQGIQIHYAGPFDLRGKDYADQVWFTKCVERGHVVSDVFLGYRKQPHMIIALKWPTEDGSFFILRTTLDMRRFVKVLSTLDISDRSDAFLCNAEGMLQTPSRFHGGVLDKVALPIPPYSPHTQVIEALNGDGDSVLISYAHIEDSPYLLMLVKSDEDLMRGWYGLRAKLIWLFLGSAVLILIVIYSLSTFMLNKVYDSDRTRLDAMQRLEQSSRLISLGRLAAGVAHEINNPLAVINENAGLIKDIFETKQEYQKDAQLMELIDAVLESVERSGRITRQLLGFARHFEPKIESLQLTDVIAQVLSFLQKEAVYRNISIDVRIPEEIAAVESDRGSLQQIFLNLINNAIQAMGDGGRLDISAARVEGNKVAVRFADTGHGIAPKELKKIFEPFFTTKHSKGGTGLGLSITYGLVRKIKGDITVESKLHEGTTFVVTLPIAFQGDVR